MSSGRSDTVLLKPLSLERTASMQTTIVRSRVPWKALIPFFSVGVALGLGLFTFEYGGGMSYFSNDPASCANCHIMQAHYDSWGNSSHRNVTTCNDCHLPHDSFVGKWFTKCDNGLLHSWAFTTGDFHEPIQIKARNRRITQNACIHCHADFVHNMLPADSSQDMLNCIHCHYSVGHAHH